MAEPNGDRRNMLKFSLPFFGPVEVRGFSAIIMLLAVVVLVNSVVVWRHAERSDEGDQKYLAAMGLMTNAMNDAAVAQREFACIIAKPTGAPREEAIRTDECRRWAKRGVVGGD